MTGRQGARLQGWPLVIGATALVGLVLVVALLFWIGTGSPHLVAAAIPLNEREVLLQTGPVDRRPIWVVYGIDGKPLRLWGERPLPGGIVEEANGRFRIPNAEPEPYEALAAGMSLSLPGQTRFVHDSVGDRLVHFREPAGILLDRFREDPNDYHLLERVRLDGSVVWSVSLDELVGPLRFRPISTTLPYAHLREGSKTLVVIVQTHTGSFWRPVVDAVSRLVLLDADSGRVISRADIARD